MFWYGRQFGRIHDAHNLCEATMRPRPSRVGRENSEMTYDTVYRDDLAENDAVAGREFSSRMHTAATNAT
jgi:hypothetical protein